MNKFELIKDIIIGAVADYINDLDLDRELSDKLFAELAVCQNFVSIKQVLGDSVPDDELDFSEMLNIVI